MGQIAVSMVLLSGAALLLRSFQNVEEQRLGMQTGGVFTVQIALPGFRYDTPRKQMQFYLDAEAAIRRLPGIRAVAFSDSVPPGGGYGMRWTDLTIDGKPYHFEGTGDTLSDSKSHARLLYGVEYSHRPRPRLHRGGSCVPLSLW